MNIPGALMARFKQFKALFDVFYTFWGAFDALKKVLGCFKRVLKTFFSYLIIPIFSLSSVYTPNCNKRTVEPPKWEVVENDIWAPISVFDSMEKLILSKLVTWK